jgi:hypothetical protein
VTVRIIEGDCREVLPTLAAESVHAIVTDPPYELGFMGKAWDSSGIAYDVGVWRECLRVLKPGGHLLAFGGSRTYHRLACAVEDAGFEIRDNIARFYAGDDDRDAFLSSLTPEQAEAFMRAFGRPATLEWLYGSGFPKSKNLDGDWEGWGTALKPSHEPIVVARKPLIGTVAENVLAHGCGALNIDGCRIAHQTVNGGNLADNPHLRGTKQRAAPVATSFGREGDETALTAQAGRWPANVIHDGSDEVLAAFPDAPGQQGDLRDQDHAVPAGNAFGQYGPKRGHAARHDAGSAARFFYCAKASREDRNVGGAENTHPTVKPTELMRYLVRLVTPPGGTVLDPFAGSGSTGRAADLEGFDAILIELLAEHAAIARRRIHGDAPLFAQIA